ncbi:MAG: hypothetical protein F6J93_38210 [Oscillatoria sp. SIO1A7]|nr:hypothetical protein [Oscillatoria sp. SIO1A7]
MSSIEKISDDLLEAFSLLEKAARIIERSAKILSSKNLESEQPWVPLAQAVEETGMSVRQMQETIRNKYWKHGKQYINTSQGIRPYYKVNPSEVQIWLQTSPEKRPPAKNKRARRS